MTCRDTLEIGRKENAQYRRDDLSPGQIRGPELPSGPGRSSGIPMARKDSNHAPYAPVVPTDDLPPQD